MSLKRRILKGGASLLALRIYSLGLMLILYGCLARWMSKEDFASFMVGTNLIILINTIGMGGINQSMIKLIAGKHQNDPDDASLLRSCWLASTLFSIPIVAIAGIILLTRIGTWLECSSAIVAAIVVCSLFAGFHKLIATSLRSLHCIALSSLFDGDSAGPVANTLFLVLLALLATSQFDSSYALWLFSIAMLITLPIGWYCLTWSVRKQLGSVDPAEIRTFRVSEADPRPLLISHILWFSMPFLFSQLLTYFSTRFDVLLAQMYTTGADTAIFAGARRLAMLPMTPVNIVMLSVSSSIAQLHAKHDIEGLRRMLRYSAAVGAILTIPLLIIGAIFAPQTLELVFGPGYRSGGHVFAILCIGQAVNCLTGQCTAFLLLSGHARYVIVVKSIAAATLCTGGVWMAKSYGIVGLAITTAAVVCLENLTLWLAARRLTGFWTHPGLNFSRSTAKSAAE